MRERRRDYELMLIISPLHSSEEQIANALDRVNQAISGAGGEVTNVDHAAPWGRRRFAYPIREYAEGEASRRPFTEGFYVLTHFTLPTTQITTIERSLKLNDSILRYLLTLVDAKGQSSAASRAAGGDDSADAAADDEELDDEATTTDEDEDEGDEDEGDDEGDDE